MERHDKYSDIEFAKGLIAVGGQPGTGKTTFAINLANSIAQNEDVLFISYQSLRKELEEMINKSGNKVNDHLTIDTNLEYFQTTGSSDILSLIRDKNYSTVIIDDIGCYAGTENINYVVRPLKAISEMANLRLIFTVPVNPVCDEDNSLRLKLRDFRWREITNQCDEIYAVYRPSAFGYLYDHENNPIPRDQIEFYSIKLETKKEFVLSLGARKQIT